MPFAHVAQWHLRRVRRGARPIHDSAIGSALSLVCAARRFSTPPSRPSHWLRKRGRGPLCALVCGVYADLRYPSIYRVSLSSLSPRRLPVDAGGPLRGAHRSELCALFREEQSCQPLPALSGHVAGRTRETDTPYPEQYRGTLLSNTQRASAQVARSKRQARPTINRPPRI